MKKIKETSVLRAQIVPNVTQFYKDFLDIPEDHQSIGFLSTDCEEILYLALDDATKKADVKVAFVNSANVGLGNLWAHIRGVVIGMISGPKVQDVRMGMLYAKDFIERHSGCYVFDGDEDRYCYAHLIPRSGPYYLKKYKIPLESAVAHLSAEPVAATYALDKALKAGDTRIAHLYRIPTRTNMGGGILYGTESACGAAAETFLNAVEYCYDNPMEIN